MPNNRRPLMSGNWKMNLNHYEAIQIMQKLAFLVGKDDFEAVDVSVHPPFTDLRSVQTLIEGDKLGFVLGAQNCHYENAGAYTGEVSPAFLNKLTVRYVICGHSERRQIFGETDEMVNKKVNQDLLLKRSWDNYDMDLRPWLLNVPLTWSLPMNPFGQLVQVRQQQPMMPKKCVVLFDGKLQFCMVRMYPSR
jgi:hypothetical protein